MVEREGMNQKAEDSQMGQKADIQMVMKQGLPSIRIKLQIFDQIIREEGAKGKDVSGARRMRATYVKAETKLRRKALKEAGLPTPPAQSVSMKPAVAFGRVPRPQQK